MGVLSFGLYCCVCRCLVWAGEPEAGEWDEQSGGRSQVSSASVSGSLIGGYNLSLKCCLLLWIPPPDRSRGRWLKFPDYRRSLLRKSCNKWDGFHFRSPRKSKRVFICDKQLSRCPRQEAEIDGIHQLVVGATENVKEGNEDIREVIFATPAWPFCNYVSLNTVISSSSQGNQKQCRLPCVDPVFPGYVLVFSSFPGLVWQLAELAGVDSVGRKKTQKLAFLARRSLAHTRKRHRDWISVLHVGSEVLSEDTEEAADSSLTLTTYFQCPKVLCRWALWQLVCGGAAVCCSSPIKLCWSYLLEVSVYTGLAVSRAESSSLCLCNI